MNTMHFLYPADMLKPRLPDELFREEANAMQAAGHLVSLVDMETFAVSLKTAETPAGQASKVVYRGWMLKPAEFQRLLESVEQQGAKACTSREQYLATHYLPNWYPLLADLTPKTVILDPMVDLVPILKQLGWERFFIKDYVKSLKTAGGSVIDQPEEIGRVMTEMKKYRGEIEGGLCVRRYEEFEPNSEIRFFVLGGVCYGSDMHSAIPPLVQECARRLSSPFFSVDVATRTDGRERIVEVGDGQVSDLVGWTVDRFASLWSEATLP
jgi:hypothetical protein